MQIRVKHLIIFCKFPVACASGGIVKDFRHFSKYSFTFAFRDKLQKVECSVSLCLKSVAASAL